MADKIPRQKKREQEPQIRNKNFKEVSFNYTKEQAVAEASRCIQCKNPGCVPGCPVLIKIPQFIKKIQEGDFLAAFEVIKEDNSLPAVCGRVCPQEIQCEGPCVLSIKSDPVAIGNLERFVADYVREQDLDIVSDVESTVDKKKVAIIGSGPAGLSCAGELNSQGYEVTVFEALHELGGVLVYGIPEFRLPKDIVGYEISALEKAGVRFKKNYLVGRIVTIDELMDEFGFSVVFVATGAGFPLFMGIPGEDLNGVCSANEYLTRINLMKAYKGDQVDTPIRKEQKVAVIGGGNTAMDAARSAKRLGADKVYIIYRRSEDEMSARLEEVEHTKAEGISILCLNTPLEYIGDEAGFVKKAVLQKMSLGEPDNSGRKRPVPITASAYELEVDQVIVAIGTQANPIIKDTTPDLETNKWGYIVTDEDGKTSKRSIYAGGDIVSGAATVILAMGAGKKAAKAITEYLKKSTV